MTGPDEPRRAEDGLPALLHEELHTADDGAARSASGERLSHGEGTSPVSYTHLRAHET